MVLSEPTDPGAGRPVVVTEHKRAPEPKRDDAARPGIRLAATIAAVACCLAAYPLATAPWPPFTIETASGPRHPLGAAIVAILLAVALRNLIPWPRLLGPERLREAGRALRWIVAITIPAAIVLGAAELDLRTIVSLSVPALAVTLLCIGTGLGGGYVAARLMGLGRRAGVLLGAGTAICGNSAVVAVAPLVRAREEDLALTIGTINLAGLALMFALPPIAEALGLSPEVFGVWAGATIHSVPQVAAAAEAHGPEAFAIATLVKLVRVAMLAPLVFLIALLVARHDAAGAQAAARIRYRSLVPWFVWGFLGVALLATFGWIPQTEIFGSPLPTAARKASAFLLALAMAAIGLDIDLRRLIGVGARALTAGALAAALLALVGLGLAVALVG